MCIEIAPAEKRNSYSVKGLQTNRLLIGAKHGVRCMYFRREMQTIHRQIGGKRNRLYEWQFPEAPDEIVLRASQPFGR